MLLTPLVLALLLPTIWIVDAANGPGANFTDLPAAVAAAASGDTILVRAGTYSPFSVAGKALTIRGAGTTQTFVTSSPLLATTIESVPAGSCFWLSGLTIGPLPSSTGLSTHTALAVIGSVVTLADAVLTGSSNAGFFVQGTPGLYAGGLSQVHATRCTFTGGTALARTGGPGAAVVGATLVADASTFTGGNSVGTSTTLTGAPGLVVVAGAASISRSSLTGGNGFGYGGAGIGVTQGGFVRFSGISSDVIQGGVSINAPVNSGSAIYADPTSSAVVHGAPSLLHGLPGLPSTSGAVVLGAQTLPYLSVSGTPTPAGELAATQPVTVTFEGVIPSAPFAAFADLHPSFSTAFAPTVVGALLVPVPTTFALIGTLDGAGSAQVVLTPSVTAPALVDVPLHVQFAVWDALTGSILLSNGWIRMFKP